MRALITVPYFDCLVEVTVQDRTILGVRKFFEDSGLCRDVKFASLPLRVREEILKRIQEETYDTE